MNQMQHARHFNTLYSDSALMRQQLVREITCLERQLERLKLRDDMLDLTTLETYEEMISTRKDMLDNLPWDD